MCVGDHHLQPNILVGTGGARPGLIAYEVASGRSTRLLSLSPGQSVYAVGLSPDGATIAAGTKAGAIHWLRWQDDRAQTGCWVHETQAAGGAQAPILALTFVAEQTAAVSDTAQRCLLWRLGGTAALETLPTGGRTVCALFRPGPSQLAGLSLSEEMLLWAWPDRNLCQVIEMPRLPQIGSLVNPVYWPAVDAWVWPAAGGVIAFYHWREGRISTAAAHSSDVYAVTVCKDELLTIGRADGWGNRWSGPEGPSGSMKAARGAIAAASWPRANTTEVVLVDDEGTARVYTWGDGRLAWVRDLSGEACRIAISSDVQMCRAALRRHQARRAQELAARVRDRITSRDRGDLGPLYQQLRALGYPQVALALRGERARADHDSIAELQAYHELAAIVPVGEPASERSLSRYAELLEVVWQPQQALVIYGQLEQLDPHNGSYRDKTKRLKTYAGLMASEDCVIEGTLPTTTLIHAAQVLAGEIKARHLLRNIGSPIHCGVLVSASDLVQRYEQAPRHTGQVPVPSSQQLELWWLSAAEARRVTTVVFAGDQTGPFPWLELGVKLFDVGLQTVLAPVAMLNAAGWRGDRPVERDSGWLLQQLQRAQSGSLASGWLEAVYRRVKGAIRQVMSQALAERM